VVVVAVAITVAAVKAARREANLKIKNKK